MKISNSELNAFYLELITPNNFVLHKNGDICHSKVDVIGRPLWQGKKNWNLNLFSFSGFFQIKHTVGPVMTTVRFRPKTRERYSCPTQEQTRDWKVPKDDLFSFSVMFHFLKWSAKNCGIDGMETQWVNWDFDKCGVKSFWPGVPVDPLKIPHGTCVFLVWLGTNPEQTSGKCQVKGGCRESHLGSPPREV